MLQKVNLAAAADSIGNLYEYLKIGTMNQHVLNVLCAENRTLDFHVHPDSDELFYCIEGEFDIELEQERIHLSSGELLIIPKGTVHRPICTGLVKCLLMELDGTLNKENTGGTYSA